MRNLINWQDQIVEEPNRYSMTDLGGGKIRLDKDPGEKFKEGTPQNALNFNTMDLAAFEAMLMASDASRKIRIMENIVDGLRGEKIQVTLNNSQLYPHNNSKKTVQMKSRNTKDYTIESEIVSVSGGAVGSIEYSDKMLNGFKVAYTGSAKAVTLNLYVRGGV